jgi:hypothetical protein
MLRLLRLLFVSLVRSFCSRRDLLLENLSLRQQLAVLKLCLAKIRSGPKSVGFDTTSIGFRTPIFARRKRVGVSWRLTNRPQHTRREQVDTPPPGTFHRVLVKVEHLYAARS